MDERVVLAVEDDEAIRALPAMALADDPAVGRPLRVVAAADAEQAIAVLRRGRVDLVPLDIGRPGMDGLELCRRVRADPALRAVPVVAVSALSPTADAERRARAAGCADFLAKPFDLGALVAYVRRHLDPAAAG